MPLALYRSTVSNSTISNKAGASLIANGGGISVSGTITVSNSTISNNFVTGTILGGNGGGIYISGIISNSLLQLVSSTITRNRADNGGGVYIENSEAIALNTTITGNISTSGINPDVVGTLTIV